MENTSTEPTTPEAVNLSHIDELKTLIKDLSQKVDQIKETERTISYTTQDIDSRLFRWDTQFINNQNKECVGLMAVFIVVIFGVLALTFFCSIEIRGRTRDTNDMMKQLYSTSSDIKLDNCCSFFWSVDKYTHICIKKYGSSPQLSLQDSTFCVGYLDNLLENKK